MDRASPIKEKRIAGNSRELYPLQGSTVSCAPVIMGRARKKRAPAKPLRVR